jgi:D-alanyl-D-alanine endopeptidase (penicillin-binding protein 7)
LALGAAAFVLLWAPDAYSRRGKVNIPERTPDGLPNVVSQSAIVVDRADGTVIFEKDADAKRPMASTGKIFVAMVARARGIDLDAPTLIPAEDRDFAKRGARTRLEVGYSYPNLGLMQALLIASDNRAPSALGRAVGLHVKELVKAMNALAAEMRLSHTRFSDPSGLRGNTSTARDMATAFRRAMDDPLLASILGAKRVTVTSTAPRARAIEYFNTNRSLVSGRNQVIAGKTGYTDKAGYCLLIAAHVADRDVVMVFLGGPYKLTRYGDFNRVVGWLEDGAPRPRRAAAPSR